MGQTDGREKRRPITVSFTQEEIEAMERFRETKTNLKSRNKLFHVAIKYYMRQVEQSGGLFDAQGFPVTAAGDPSAHPGLPEPIEGKALTPETGPASRSVRRRCKTHGVYLIKTAACPVCTTEPG